MASLTFPRLAASHTASDPERLSALRSVLPRLPDDTRALLSTICHLVTLSFPPRQGSVPRVPVVAPALTRCGACQVAAVAAEHDACYKDGILTRQAALAQLFGPLMLRPSPASFDADMAAAVYVGRPVWFNVVVGAIVLLTLEWLMFQRRWIA